MTGTKNKTVLLFLLISIVTLSLIASTYAFLRTTLDNSRNFRASLKAGTMSLVFSDGNPGFNAQIDKTTIIMIQKLNPLFARNPLISKEI